jgi:hypothetical protein
MVEFERLRDFAVEAQIPDVLPITSALFEQDVLEDLLRPGAPG